MTILEELLIVKELPLPLGGVAVFILIGHGDDLVDVQLLQDVLQELAELSCTFTRLLSILP